MISLSVACLATLRVNKVLLSENLKQYYQGARCISQGQESENFTDNENASRIVLVGSPKQHLQCLVLDIFQLCLVNDIQIDAQWIPRDANVRADLLSRFVDKDDWSLNCEIFAQLDSRLGLHSVDRFASHYNAQLRRFNSRFLSPGCCAVDGLSQDWHDENNWLCPPVSIICGCY